MDVSKFQVVIASILPIIFAVTLHEVAHGYVAYLLGDRTAKILDRLTINPAKHIDIIGTLIVPTILLFLGGVMIGWAKPMPINTRCLHRLRRDLALISCAGPMANFLMVFWWAGIAKLGLILLLHGVPGSLAINTMGNLGIVINFMLMLINIIPLPPLDGAHILALLLPKKVAYHYERMAPYGLIVLLLLLAFGVINNIIAPVLLYLNHWIKILFVL